MSRILVIDDDHMVARLLEEFLTGEGHEVAVVHSGDEGFKLALEFQPDLILQDVMLPDATGFQMLDRFRLNPVTQTTPIIMMSGAARHPNQQKLGSMMGADDYILKPFKIDDIEGRIQRLLANAPPRPAAPPRAKPPEPKLSPPPPLEIPKPEAEAPPREKQKPIFEKIIPADNEPLRIIPVISEPPSWKKENPAVGSPAAAQSPAPPPPAIPPYTPPKAIPQYTPPKAIPQYTPPKVIPQYIPPKVLPSYTPPTVIPTDTPQTVIPPDIPPIVISPESPPPPQETFHVLPPLDMPEPTPAIKPITPLSRSMPGAPRYKSSLIIFSIHLLLASMAHLNVETPLLSISQAITDVVSTWAIVLGLVSALCAVTGIILEVRQALRLVGWAMVPLLMRSLAMLTGISEAFKTTSSQSVWKHPPDLFELACVFIIGMRLRALPGSSQTKTILSGIAIFLLWVLAKQF